MIKIILITGFSLVAFLITMLTIVAIDQQRQINKIKRAWSNKKKPEVIMPLTKLKEFLKQN